MPEFVEGNVEVVPEVSFATLSFEDLEALLRSQAVHLPLVIMRQVEQPETEPYRYRQDPAVAVLSRVVDAFQTGSGVMELAEPVDQLIRNQSHRAKLISQLIISHQYGRLVRFISAREPLEAFLVQCSQRGDLTPVEALSLLKYVKEELGGILPQIQDAATDVRDVMDLVRKTDHALQLKQGQIAKKFLATSTQGREVIRHLATRLVRTVEASKKPTTGS